MNFENPKLFLCDQSSIAEHIAPDCEINPMPPGRIIPLAKDALSLFSEFKIPRQFGPKTPIEYFFEILKISSSSRLPSSPVSENPALIIIEYGIFFFPHSSSARGVKAAGIEITARSTFAGISITLEKTFFPKIFLLEGLTKYTFPENLWESIFFAIVCPIFFEFEETPMTATDFGYKSVLSII